MSHWSAEIKKRCDALIDGDVVNDPVLGEISTTQVGKKFKIRVARVSSEIRVQPRRYEGVSNTGQHDNHIALGTWHLDSQILNLSSEGESPSQCMEKMVERARGLAAQAEKYASLIEGVLEKGKVGSNECDQ